jgi:hypothetical protein
MSASPASVVSAQEGIRSKGSRSEVSDDMAVVQREILKKIQGRVEAYFPQVDLELNDVKRVSDMFRSKLGDDGSRASFKVALERIALTIGTRTNFVQDLP